MEEPEHTGDNLKGVKHIVEHSCMGAGYKVGDVYVHWNFDVGINGFVN